MAPPYHKLAGPWDTLIASRRQYFSVIILKHESRGPCLPGERRLSGELSAGVVDRAALFSLLNDPNVLSVSPERTLSVCDLPALSSVGIPDFCRKSDFSGRGVTAAFLETGVYPHPLLQDRLVAFWDTVRMKNRPYDDHGHGTHVAGLFCGAKDEKNGFGGVAPGARFVMIKVLDNRGLCPEARVLYALQKLFRHRRDFGLNILSLSIGTAPIFPLERDPLVRTLRPFHEAGIAVFAASGNSGPGNHTVTSPAIAPFVIAVGAANSLKHPHTAADFTGRIYSKAGIPKPDIWAPGVNLLSLTIPMHPGAENRHFLRKSGTSMATPVTAGVGALLLEETPGLSPAALKNRLLDHTRPIHSPRGPVPEVYFG